MSYSLILFDFDGTLADTRAPIVRAKQETMRRLGLPVADEEACASVIGLSAAAGFRLLYPAMPEEQLERCVVLSRSLFEAYASETPPPLFPGVRETLRLLNERGKTLTIASSRHNSSLEAFLTSLQLRDCFAYVLGGDDTERLKPDPDPVIKTLQAFDTPPEKALVVGDMPYDILMARRADAAACGVTYGNAGEAALRSSGADYIIHRFEELLDLLS